ncbi:MAG TPA: OmpA family protein [Nitrospiraceae bacterium]|nr:OmpA family protein [Nitrospiraceae bacterium]
MSKGAQQAVYTGNTTTGSVAPDSQTADRGMKEVMIVGGTVLLLAIGIGIAWMVASQSEQMTPASSVSFPSSPVAIPDNSTTAARTAETASQPTHLASVSTQALPTQLTESLHADISFDFGKTRLTDEAKVYLNEHASFMTRNQDYGLVIQGYTDARGSSLYNRALGLKRAEAVKDHLISLGVPEYRIKTASLGEEGVLCLDDSPDCLTLNRRAHLEFIRVGASHLVPPAEPANADSMTVPVETATTEPATESAMDSGETSLPMQPLESREGEGPITSNEQGVTP